MDYTLVARLHQPCTGFVSLHYFAGHQKQITLGGNAESAVIIAVENRTGHPGATTAIAQPAHGQTCKIEFPPGKQRFGGKMFGGFANSRVIRSCENTRSAGKSKAIGLVL